MRGKVVLFYEDDLMLLDVMGRILEEEGVTVEVARDAKEALDKLRRLETIDLLILDLMVPVKAALEDPTGGLESGLRLLQLMREDEKFRRWRDLPVLCYTVRTDPRLRRQLMELGAQVMPKGDPPEGVLEKIREMLADGEETQL